MAKFKLTSVYNDEELEKEDGINYLQEVLVEWNEIEDRFKMTIQTTTNEFDEYHRLVSTDTKTREEYFDVDAVWQLMLENTKRYYTAFHALATGCNGDHLNYMIVNEPEILEED